MNRIISIDVFRGVTMFLMLWVNDFWTLNSIPKWLKHAVSGEDYLGFSDLIRFCSKSNASTSLFVVTKSNLFAKDTSLLVLYVCLPEK